MIENKIESHWNETIRGFLLRPDTDGPGKVLQRYLANGTIDLKEYYDNKDCRSVVMIDSDINHDIVIDRPILLRFTTDFLHTLYIKSERIFVDSDFCFIKKIVIVTDDDCYLDTCNVLTKILIADCTVDLLTVKNVNNFMLIDCKVNELHHDQVSSFMNLSS